MTNKNQDNNFKRGFNDGLAIGLGYLSVSFSFGIMAVSAGLTWWQAVIISISNLTSAGQVAGVGIMAASGTLFEMFLSQLVINVRYSLMAISLSQKVDSSFNLPTRAILGYGITDEVFGVASSADHDVGRNYFIGLLTLPVAGWTLGTLLGSILGSVLPENLTIALAMGIYGMFVAIVLPVARQNRRILIVVLMAIMFALIIKYIPLFSFLSGGFAAIISAVLASAIGAFILPVDDKDDKEVNNG